MRDHLIFLWTVLLLSLCLCRGEALAFTHFVERDLQGKLHTARWGDSNHSLNFWLDGEFLKVEGKSILEIARRAAKHWSDLKGSSMKLTVQRLQVNIQADNFDKEVKIQDKRQEIVMDSDGKIMKKLGFDADFVAGIGVPITTHNKKGALDGPFTGPIVDAFVIVSTRQAWNVQRMERILTHELGHALGMGHTNIVHHIRLNRLPIMFYSPGQQSGAVALHPDDRAGLTSLYPAKDFEKHFGALAGKVMKIDGKKVFGAVVIAVPVKDDEQSIGVWSDPDGNFQIPALFPGEYHLLVRAIDGSSKVHQMDVKKHLGGIYTQAVTKFCPEFYNDKVFQVCTAPPVDPDTVTVLSGRTLSGFVMRESDGIPSPAPKCFIGSAPKLAGHLLLFPNRVEPWGKRGAECPILKEEAPDLGEDAAESPDTVRDTILKEKEAMKSESEELPKDATVDTTCGCDSAGEAGTHLLWFGFLCLMLAGLRRFSSRKNALLGVFIGFLLFPGVGEALTIRKPSLQELVKKSDQIVLVEVLDNRSVVSSFKGLPLLITRFRVLQHFKGPKSTEVRIRLLGKSNGRFRIKVPDIPRFQKGSKSILFLRNSKGSSFSLLCAFYFGVFDLKPVKSGSSSTPIYTVDNRGGLLPKMPYGLFVQKIKALLPKVHATPLSAGHSKKKKRAKSRKTRKTRKR